MNYPVWDLSGMTSGSLVALISILHAYIAHLAVGGGLFLWISDYLSIKTNNPQLLQYVRRHTWFFLLLTMVFGGVTGVGIWFIIALSNPAATSSLIHSFVFGWAIEWVFFIGEITALLIYRYRFDRMQPKYRVRIAFFYFLFAWLSLAVINGILSFMLTPGKWLETYNFWNGILNPSYLPSLLFRTAASAMIAGLFGYITAVFSKQKEFKPWLIKYCTKWLLYPVPFIIIGAIWYFHAVPGPARITNFTLNAQTGKFTWTFFITSVLLFIGGLLFLLKAKPLVQKIGAFFIVIIGLGWYGSFEYMREYARKPYIIYNYMYSTSVLKQDVALLNREGFLKHAKWVEIKVPSQDNFLEAGRELFRLQCQACHTIGGRKNDILKKTKNLTYMGMIAQLYGQGKVLGYMPEFVGTPAEMEALAAYITKELNGKPLITEPSEYTPPVLKNEIPPFNSKKDEFVLLAWNDLGMHCISDCDPWFVFLPPANTLEAQLVKRGPKPEIASEGYTIKYRVEKGFENPSAHVRFWDFAENYFGVSLEKNVGLAGNGMQGEFKYHDENNSFKAEMVPLTPYNDDGSFNPYPQFFIDAVDNNTQEIVASTIMVAPVSTEMGCRNCHGGGWRVNGVSGVEDITAINILKAHDRINKTDLYASALSGHPKLCQSCHADPAIGAPGIPEHNNFSAAVHGWHANYMYAEGSDACALCHPAFPKGNTRCSRGVHAQVDITCINCHGTIDDHAAGLLNAQASTNSSSMLLANLQTKDAASPASVKPRIPWVQEPDCNGCHINFQQPDSGASSFNKWNEAFTQLYRIRTDIAGMRCEACHNSTHSVYPAKNPYGKNRDNTQPLQYEGMPLPIGSDKTCAVCHKQSMPYSGHHPNMVRNFRNTQLLTSKK